MASCLRGMWGLRVSGVLKGVVEKISNPHRPFGADNVATIGPLNTLMGWHQGPITYRCLSTKDITSPVVIRPQEDRILKVPDRLYSKDNKGQKSNGNQKNIFKTKNLISDITILNFNDANRSVNRRIQSNSQLIIINLSLDSQQNSKKESDDDVKERRRKELNSLLKTFSAVLMLGGYESWLLLDKLVAGTFWCCVELNFNCTWYLWFCD